MRKTHRITASMLIICIALTLCACGSSSALGSYRVLETFDTQEFSIGFRNDDFLRYYVDAALKELAADGTIHSIALSWFAEDTTTFEADAEALDRIGDIPGRSLIVGVDAEAFPMSYVQDGSYCGFDVDVARAVCGRLGWDVRFISIEAEDAYIELSSGNIDCAWGGLVLDSGTADYTVLASYMSNELVLVVSGDSGIRSKSGLRGKTLAIDVDQKYINALESDQALKESFGKVTRLTGGAQACFGALESGTADAIIVYSVAARYFDK